MKKLSLNGLAVLIIGLFLTLSGCSSLNDARTLHNQGKDDEALKMAAKYLDDGNGQGVRLDAIKLVGDIGGDEAGKLLMPLLDDEDETVKNASIKAIGIIKYVPASKKLVEMSLTAQDETFEEIAAAIRNIGTPAIEELVKKYGKAQGTQKNIYKKLMFEVGPSVAEEVAKTLAGKSFFGNQANFELLIAFQNPLVASWMLKEIENEEIADMIVEGLIKLGTKSVIPVMEKLQTYAGKSGDAVVKERLVRTLGELKDQRTIPLLEQMTRDDNESVSNASEFALRKIRGF